MVLAMVGRCLLHIKGSRPEWCISTMIYSRDTPFRSGTLDIIQLSSQNSSAERTSGEEKERAARRDMETDCSERSEKQTAGPWNGSQSSSRQSQMEVPSRHLVCQMALKVSINTLSVHFLLCTSEQKMPKLYKIVHDVDLIACYRYVIRSSLCIVHAQALS